MLLDISDLLKNPGGQMDFECELSLKQFDFQQLGVSFEQPVSVKGELKNTGGVVVMEAKVQGVYETCCDRCGEPISVPIAFTATEDFVKGTDVVNEGDAIQLESHYIQLEEVIGENAFASIPLKNLCKEDCKGICQICGQNWNVGSCDCKEDNWDPRFDCLKGLFD